MANGITLNVDLTHFKQTLERYMENTNRELKDVCNNKLFDIARFSFKDTAKADTGTIRAKMKTVCQKYPDRTIAQMIAIMKMRSKGIKEFDLRKETQTVTNKKVGAAGYTKSGWINAMKSLGSAIGLKGFSVSGTSKNIGPGGASPVRQAVSIMKGSVWNDVTGKHNADKVEQIKAQGANSAVDKVDADMVKHIEEKLAKHNAEFNRG